MITAAASGSAALVLSAGAFAPNGWQDVEVAVMHGIPDETVDVHADGDTVLEDLEPGTVSEPISMPAGTSDLRVTEAGAGPDAEAVVEADEVEFHAGSNSTVAAHLDDEGEPVLTPFVNETYELGEDEAQMTVRHVAAAPALDVRTDGEPAAQALTEPEEQVLETAPGTVSFDAVVADTEETVLEPADLELAGGNNTLVYVWGDTEGGGLDVAVQNLDLTP
ncbi:DUF4397 domain-containing protein [Nocardiopsis coralli]|nr:DUF4397 domain-containing protein [Nocardiopsis coralli]